MLRNAEKSHKTVNGLQKSMGLGMDEDMGESKSWFHISHQEIADSLTHVVVYSFGCRPNYGKFSLQYTEIFY